MLTLPTTHEVRDLHIPGEENEVSIRAPISHQPVPLA